VEISSEETVLTGAEQLRILIQESQKEYDQLQRELREIDVLIRQSSTEVEKLAQRNNQIGNRVRQMELHLDTYPRDDIKELYSAAGPAIVKSLHKAGREVFALAQVGNHDQHTAGRPVLLRQGGQHERSRTGHDSTDRERLITARQRLGEAFELRYGIGVRHDGSETSGSSPGRAPRQHVAEAGEVRRARRECSRRGFDSCAPDATADGPSHEAPDLFTRSRAVTEVLPGACLR